ERSDLGLPPIPIVVHRIGVLTDAKQVFVFAGVDLDLELQRRLQIGLRGESKHQVDRVPSLNSIESPKPRQRFPDRINSRADRLRLRLYQVDVFGITQRSLEQQLVDCRATAERDLAAQGWSAEQVA